MDLTKRYGNVYYHSRRKPGIKNVGFKAGNLNSAVRFLFEGLGVPAPWIAVLDADMIPEQGFLRVLLAHATDNSRTAMATLPQVGSKGFIYTVDVRTDMSAFLQYPC